MSHYLPRREAVKRLGVHYHTLYALAERKEIETVTIGKRQLYNVDKYLRLHGIKESPVARRKICYCRVSSQKQRDDLGRQVEEMRRKYPTYEIITDIASGLNYKREGLEKIMRYATKGEVELLVVAYKDRLMSFGYEMLEWLIKECSDGEILIENGGEELTPTEEISRDILAIMNVYVAKVNGLRKYKKKIKNTINNKNKNND